MPAPRKKGSDRIREEADKGNTQPTPEQHTYDTPSTHIRHTMERHNVWIPAAYWQELQRRAAVDARTVSELVREALREYLR